MPLIVFLSPLGLRLGVRFSDFRMFNQALLARHAWRLLTRPDSLCARPLKSKYYPNDKLEDTVFSGNASSTWTAIIHGLGLLKRGLRRVGNGESIEYGVIVGSPGLSLINQSRHKGDAYFGLFHNC